MELKERFTVEVCDITKQETDAIVNAANRVMLGGGGVDGAIHRAAGPKLVRACAEYPADRHGYRVETGGAKITPGFDLKAKFVIHTAGPDALTSEGAADVKNGQPLLRGSYRNSLELAKENGCKSVAFPSISTGIFSYPLDVAAKAATEEIAAFLKANPDMTVKMCVYDPFDSKGIIKAYTEAFEACC